MDLTNTMLGGALALMIIREVFKFLEQKLVNDNGKGTELDDHWLMRIIDLATEILGIAKESKVKIDIIHDDIKRIRNFPLAN